MEAIEFNELLQKTKQRMNFEYKPIKTMMLYNYLNDNIPSLVINCLNEDKQNIIGAFHISNFTLNGVHFKGGFRLILILEDNDDIKNEKFEKLKNFIKNEDKLEKGIFVIKKSEFEKFKEEYSIFIEDEIKDELKEKLNKTSFPLCAINNLLYVGNFLNSKNLHQIKLLKIKSIFSFLKEEDTELKKVFSDVYFFPVDEENHSEINFYDIIEAIENANTPILLYCFSGQSVSLAVLIAYLMHSKKWTIEFSTAYVMKIFPNFKIPSWLYSQIQRLKITK